MKLYKNILCILILLMTITVGAAVVNDNDGAAFITRAEFDSLRADFQSEVNRYNEGIDAKIEGAIAAYLGSIKVDSVETCNLMISTFRYPLTILDEHPMYIRNHLNSDALIYRPEERYTIALSTMGSGDDTPSSSQRPKFHLYKFKVDQDKNGRAKNMMFNISTFSETRALVDSVYDDFEDTIVYDVPLGQSYTYVNDSGRGLAVAFDETSYYINWRENLNTDVRPGLFSNYTYIFKPNSYGDDASQNLQCRMYVSWQMSNRYDQTTFQSIDDWYGGNNNNSLQVQRCEAAQYPKLIRVSETSSSISDKINTIYNDGQAMLPVVYNGKIKLMNHKNWREYARLNRNVSTYDYTLFQSQILMTSPSREQKYLTLPNPSNAAELHTVATAGWGVTAETKKSDADWYDTSLIYCSRIYYQLEDNVNKKKIDVKMIGGIPIWHSDNNGNGELTLKLSDFDSSFVHPKIYISSSVIEGIDETSFTNLYDISLNNVDYNKHLNLSKGENKIYIRNIKKDDMVYIKILGGANEGVILSEAPTMKLNVTTS